ncbi:hypothetical protein GCM10009682_24300 [Luedemannella flava]|uniref:HD domain-containing protein n=1 Tax=Luedemannella flava TaxID=349316 RepID=A0ABP4Y685_9ACTN
MSLRTVPRDPMVALALRDARRWCVGQIIDDRPAIAHAVRVADTIARHVEQPAPVLLAAALLHDSPEFAPPDLDLDAYLTSTYDAEVTRIVRALQVEHLALDTDHPIIPAGDIPVLVASTADKIVALGSLLRRARNSGDVCAFFAARPALVALLPHFDEFGRQSTGLAPPSMTADFLTALRHLEHAASAPTVA